MASDALFIDLAPVDQSEQVLSEIARSLGVRDAGDLTLRESLHLATRDRRLVLLLDNFEHVIDAAPLIGELLANAPELRILVTNREALHLSGETLQPFAREALSPSGLAGRESEEQRLAALLAAAEAGQGHLVLVGGEAGIGKTALVRALTAAAAAHGRDRPDRPLLRPERYPALRSLA